MIIFAQFPKEMNPYASESIFSMYGFNIVFLPYPFVKGWGTKHD